MIVSGYWNKKQIKSNKYLVEKIKQIMWKIKAENCEFI